MLLDKLTLRDEDDSKGPPAQVRQEAQQNPIYFPV